MRDDDAREHGQGDGGGEADPGQEAVRDSTSGAAGAGPHSGQSDAELRDALAAAGFPGRDYDEAEQALIEYGYGVMRALLASNMIFAECAQDKLFLPTPPHRLSKEDCEDLAWDTVAGAMRTFKRNALGGWRPDGGASLKTYFRRRLRQQFANFYRKWWDGEQKNIESAGAIRSEPPQIGPDEAFELKDETCRALARLESYTAAILVLNDAGYAYAEIAEVLDLTQKAVEGRMRRHRQRSNERMREAKSQAMSQEEVGNQLRRRQEQIRMDTEGHGD